MSAMKTIRSLHGIIRPTTRSIITRRNLSAAAASAIPTNITEPETILTTLNSGFRVATENNGMKTATVGVFINAGSRFETPKNNGVAHFLEHLAFKGTKKRSQYGLELEVENIGAHLNAYTSRESTVYYAKCFASDIERAIEMLSDILLHSVYGAEEMSRERGVIIREAEEVARMQQQEVVFDVLHEGAFHGTPLSMTILGPIKNIQSITRDDLLKYVKKYYKGPRMVLVATGGVDHDNVVTLAEKYFGIVDAGDASTLKFEKGKFNECQTIMDHKEMNLVYGCIAFEGPTWTHHDSIAMQVVNTLMGQFDRTQGVGMLMPSRLTRRIDQDSGVQSYLSFTTSYIDTGLTGVYFTADPHGVRHLADAVCEELVELCHDVDPVDLERAKRTLFTNSLLMLDGSTAICEDIGNQFLRYDRRVPLAEFAARVAAVDVETVRRICRDYFIKKPIATTVIGNTEGWPSLAELKSKLTL